jgi:sialidase-1
MRATLAFVFALVLLTINAPAGAAPAAVLELAPGEGNPRNSEGDFITLKDGRILFVYTHFTGGFDDASTAHLASRESGDGGRTWSATDKVVLPNEGGFNIMSVSLIRLNEGIGLLYLRKESNADCRAYLRVSRDEGETWGDPVLCMQDVGYYVVNNDRIIRLGSGRLVIPAALHTHETKEFTGRAVAMCYLSDDDGLTWRRSETILQPPAESKTGLQEPAVIELKDGRMLMLCRTDQGCQLRSYSSDGGVTWSPVERTDILSPVSPASVARIPGSGNLVLVWNDHKDIAPELKDKRTPLTVAVSDDEGTTWKNRFNVEDSPVGWYCYTAIHFADDAMLLGYCAGDTTKENGLARTRLTRVPLEDLAIK